MRNGNVSLIERYIMFKKSLVCLMLIFVLMMSSCSTVPVREEVSTVPVKKEVVLFPQNNIIEYVLDSAIKKFPKEAFQDRKVTMVEIKTNCQNKETLQLFVNYFAESFERNVTEFVSIEEADVAMQMTLKVNYDFQLPKAPRGKATSSYLLVGLEDINPEDLVEPPELKYKYYETRETMAVEFSVIAIDLKTKEIMHFDTATCVSVFDGSGFNEK